MHYRLKNVVDYDVYGKYGAIAVEVKHAPHTQFIAHNTHCR